MWEGDWDFYEGSMEEDRAFVTIDLAARSEAPLASHAARLQIRFAMQQPREDGLRASEEAEAIFAVEDKVVEAMGRVAGAIHVARVTAQGYTELIFYLPADKKAAAENPPSAVGDVAPYRLEWFVEDDPEWEKYDELFPNRYALQSISNRRLVRQMVEAGDQIDVAREIDHVVVFASADQARGAAEKLASSGFRIDDPRENDNGSWSLEFHRDDPCDGDNPDRFVFEILDLVEPFEGEYDGWGSMVVRDQA
jgi:regulator of RNase E activity RraB